MYLIFVAESDDDSFDLNKEKEGHGSDSSKETLCFFMIVGLNVLFSLKTECFSYSQDA